MNLKNRCPPVFTDIYRKICEKINIQERGYFVNSCVLFVWVVPLLSMQRVSQQRNEQMRNINHPLCGCAVFVIQKNHLSVIIRLFKPVYNERKGDFNGQEGK